jgi:Mn-containing catalase
MSDKPSYLGLLNAIAVGECRAHAYLTVWIDKTNDPAVRSTLATVAAREGEHGMSFAKRLNELGYTVREKDDPGFAKRMEIAAADCSDLDKMKALGLHRLDSTDKPDIFDDMFKNHSIDIKTGELLGRYIAEERDSARLLRQCYEQLKRRAKKGAGTVVRDADERLDSLETKIDALTRAVEELRQITCAQTMPVTTT